MLFLLVLAAALHLGCHGTWAHRQHILSEGRIETQGRPVQVAVIGAGAAGSSAAYHLSKYAAEADLTLNITVYERCDYIGGRSTTVNVHGHNLSHAELGASIFVDVNHILVEAVRAFNLTTSSFGLQSRQNLAAPSLGIWDGTQFVVTLSPSGPSWWDTAKLLWRYGLSPVRTRSLMKGTVGKFLELYNTPHFPFPSLTEAASDVGLPDITGVTGAELLSTNGIGLAFANDIVQASTRVNYAQNLEYIHGLETMVCMATDGAMSVEGGNWQIFEHMLQTSRANIMLDTAVKNLGAGQDGKLLIGSAQGNQAGVAHSEVDAIIIAAPFHQTGISIKLENITLPEKIAYVALHVTLFTSPCQLSKEAFNIPVDQQVPLTILTTLPKDETPRDGSKAAGSPGFYSISTLDVVENPTTGDQEYLYKIFSPEEANTAWIIDHLDSGRSDPEHVITWMVHKLWHSYPEEVPRVEFDDIELGHNVWYTGGMESFISTMETNALMGKNVANLLVSRFAANTYKSWA